MRRRRARSGFASSGLDSATALLLASRDDPASFTELYRGMHEDIFAYAYRRVMCPEIAADLTAETFARALQSLDQFDSGRGTAEQWLYGIARNQVRMWARSGAVDRRARQRIGLVTPEYTEADTKMIEDRHDAGPLVAAVRAVLLDMRAADREIIELRVVENLPYESIAIRLDITPVTARVRCSRALARLRAELEVRMPTIDVDLA
jgi:RNA polymerase sigma-70 factor (ECF subfamily)